jgi:hypothetical protein
VRARHLAPSNATTVLVLGILSIVVCELLGPVAWVMGNETLGQMDAGLMDDYNRGSAVAGRILGIIATVLLVAVIPFVLFFVLANLGVR